MKKEYIFIFKDKAEKLIEKSLCISVIGLAHGHIYSMVKGLLNAGKSIKLKYVYDEDTRLVDSFLKEFPEAVFEKNTDKIFIDPETKLIVSADIPSRRAEIGIKAMKNGKDYFVDKAPMTSLKQITEVKKVMAETKRKYFVYYCESIDNDAAIYARDLIKRGVIGKVFHVSGAAPHRLNIETRPWWFFNKDYTGGILTDLICHQIHQFLDFSGADSCKVISARTDNFAHKDRDMDDFGDVMVTADNGVTGHFRVDWFSPAGINTWGDSRMIIEGTKGYIELRKNCDIGFNNKPDHVYVATEEGVYYENVNGKAQNNFFYNLLNDCFNRTDTALDTEVSFNAIEAAITAQNLADRK